MRDSFSILVFADVVGKIGRDALKQILPEWKKKYKPILTITNIENLAHGAGITAKTLSELDAMGIDAFTGGNHLWDKPAYMDIFADPTWAARIARPLNEVKDVPGSGRILLERNGIRFALLNVMGQVFFKQAYRSPFIALDSALADTQDGTVTLVDIHAEATSEKAVLGRWLDGRVSMVWGSHTHVPSADERILPKGTGFITDIGPCAAHNESIGIVYEAALAVFKDRIKTPLTPPDTGAAEVNALLVEFDGDSTSPSRLTRLRRLVDVL